MKIFTWISIERKTKSVRIESGEEFDGFKEFKKEFKSNSFLIQMRAIGRVGMKQMRRIKYLANTYFCSQICDHRYLLANLRAHEYDARFVTIASTVSSQICEHYMCTRKTPHFICLRFCSKLCSHFCEQMILCSKVSEHLWCAPKKLVANISFFCSEEWVSGIWGPLSKMVKVKWDKLCGTDRNGILGRIIRDGGSNT